jgi:hypothetical protein
MWRAVVYVAQVGDISYADGEQPVWDAYMNEMERIASSVPYQTCSHTRARPQLMPGRALPAL